MTIPRTAHLLCEVPNDPIDTVLPTQMTNEDLTDQKIFDQEIDPLLSSLSLPSVVSVHGESGTGKSIVAAQTASMNLRLGRTVNVFLLGQTAQVSQFLNQTMGIGLDLYRHLRTNALRLFQREPLSFGQLTLAMLAAPQSDLVVVDHVEHVLGTRVADAERALAWIMKSRQRSSLFLAGIEVGTERAWAHVQMDLTRAGRDVELAHADSIVDIRIGSRKFTRSLRVASTGLEVWT